MKTRYLFFICIAAAILVALKFVTFSPKDNLRLDGTAIDLQKLNQGLQAFHAACKRYPKTDEGLRALITEERPKDCAGFAPLRSSEIPLSDRWGKPFQFVSDGVTYQITSVTDARVKTDQNGQVAVPTD